MHETYHLANHIARHLDNNSSTIKELRNLMYNIEFRYFEEAGAMAKEWQYLSSIPADIRKSIVEEIEASDRLSKDHKDFLVRAFSSQARRAVSYVIQEHKAGRHRKEDFIEDKELDNKEKLVKIAFVISAILGSATHCYDLRRDKSTNSAFYKHVCKRHPLVLTEK